MSELYVLGAGMSGLLWGYYHPDYRLVTDQLGRVVTGADPVVWLNDTDLTRKLLTDLGFLVRPVKKEIGYRCAGATRSFETTAKDHPGLLDDVLVKKMVPWEALDAARCAGIEVRVVTPSRTFTKDSGVLRYLDVDVKEVAARLVEAVKYRISIDRVLFVDADGIATESSGTNFLGYDRLVSTLPAPVFKRLWSGESVMPRLHHCPVTFVVSAQKPEWWEDRYAVVYDADLDSPVSRVGRFGDTWRYEFTGRPDEDTLNDYLPVAEGRFVNPYGRIVQDVVLEPPDPKITFLGRSAEWDYRGLIDRTLERVYGQR